MVNCVEINILLKKEAKKMGACLSIFGTSKNETEKEGKEKLIGNEE